MGGDVTSFVSRKKRFFATIQSVSNWEAFRDRSASSTMKQSETNRANEKVTSSPLTSSICQQHYTCDDEIRRSQEQAKNKIYPKNQKSTLDFADTIREKLPKSWQIFMKNPARKVPLSGSLQSLYLNLDFLFPRKLYSCSPYQLWMATSQSPLPLLM